MKRPTKNCAVCGREFQWRKKWRDSWNQVKYCSKACRQTGLSDIDAQLEDAILRLLRARKTGGSICPSEAARDRVGNGDEARWRRLLEPARRAARRLAHQGKVVILQGGRRVDPSKFKGPVRLKMIVDTEDRSKRSDSR